MTRKSLALCALAFALAPVESEAAAIGSPGWSVITGRTVGNQVDVLHVQAGWPGISATLFHGATPRVDLGGIFTFNYGFEGDVQEVRPGLKFQGLLRANLVDHGKISLGINFAPGGLVYFYPRSTAVGGVAIPMGLALGIRASNELNVGLAFELPMFVIFSSRAFSGQLVVPVLFGGGIEYFFERNLALTFQLKMGPMIFTADDFTDFDLQALMGLAFRL